MDERKLTGAAFGLSIFVSTETLEVEFGKLSIGGKFALKLKLPFSLSAGTL
jgi:hypothetical protein